MRRVASLLGLGLLVLSAAAAASPGGEGKAAYRLRWVFTARYPVHVAAPPGKPRKVYVVEQHGRILVAVDGRLRKKPFLDIRRLVSRGEEQGLLSLAFSPTYAEDRTFYVDYTDRKGDTRVVGYRANRAGTAAVAGSRRVALFVDQPGPQHNGGQLAFGPDGRLYVSLGDGECCDDPAGRAQNMETLLGKLVRLDVGGGGPPEIVALGLRNPWRFSFDRATGDLYVADVGAGRWEEVDYLARAEAGALVNLGWDVWEGREIKEDKPPNPQGRLTFPIHEYGHDSGCSITGGFVYRGAAIPSLRGRYVFGDYCSGAVWSLRVEAGKATDVRREPVTVSGLSSFGEDAKGELYATALDGAVFKLVPS